MPAHMILSGDSVWNPFIHLLRSWCDQGGLLRPSHNVSFLWCPSAERESERERKASQAERALGDDVMQSVSAPQKPHGLSVLWMGARGRCWGEELDLDHPGLTDGFHQTRKPSHYRAKPENIQDTWLLSAALQHPNEGWVFSDFLVLSVMHVWLVCAWLFSAKCNFKSMFCLTSVDSNQNQFVVSQFFFLTSFTS